MLQCTEVLWFGLDQTGNGPRGRTSEVIDLVDLDIEGKQIIVPA